MSISFEDMVKAGLLHEGKLFPGWILSWLRPDGCGVLLWCSLARLLSDRTIPTDPSVESNVLMWPMLAVKQTEDDNFALPSLMVSWKKLYGASGDRLDLNKRICMEATGEPGEFLALALPTLIERQAKETPGNASERLWVLLYNNLDAFKKRHSNEAQSLTMLVDSLIDLTAALKPIDRCSLSDVSVSCTIKLIDVFITHHNECEPRLFAEESDVPAYAYRLVSTLSGLQSAAYFDRIAGRVATLACAVFKAYKRFSSVEAVCCDLLNSLLKNKLDYKLENGETVAVERALESVKKVNVEILKKTKTKNSDDDFIVVKSNWKFDPKNLTERQREALERRREDIPALHQDLSQSQDERSLQVWKAPGYDSEDTASNKSSEKKASPHLSGRTVKMIVDCNGGDSELRAIKPIVVPSPVKRIRIVDPSERTAQLIKMCTPESKENRLEPEEREKTSDRSAETKESRIVASVDSPATRKKKSILSRLDDNIKHLIGKDSRGPDKGTGDAEEPKSNDGEASSGLDRAPKEESIASEIPPTLDVVENASVRPVRAKRKTSKLLASEESSAGRSRRRSDAAKEPPSSQSDSGGDDKTERDDQNSTENRLSKVESDNTVDQRPESNKNENEILTVEGSQNESSENVNSKSPQSIVDKPENRDSIEPNGDEISISAKITTRNQALQLNSDEADLSPDRAVLTKSKSAKNKVSKVKSVSDEDQNERSESAFEVRIIKPDPDEPESRVKADDDGSKAQTENADVENKISESQRSDDDGIKKNKKRHTIANSEELRKKRSRSRLLSQLQIETNEGHPMILNGSETRRTRRSAVAASDRPVDCSFLIGRNESDSQKVGGSDAIDSQDVIGSSQEDFVPFRTSVSKSKPAPVVAAEEPSTEETARAETEPFDATPHENISDPETNASEPSTEEIARAETEPFAEPADVGIVSSPRVERNDERTLEFLNDTVDISPIKASPEKDDPRKKDSTSPDLFANEKISPPRAKKLDTASGGSSKSDWTAMVGSRTAQMFIKCRQNGESDRELGGSPPKSSENAQLLGFKKDLSSLMASPVGPPILKRKLEADDSGTSPVLKRKRVSFHDPPVSITMSVERYLRPYSQEDEPPPKPERSKRSSVVAKCLLNRMEDEAEFDSQLSDACSLRVESPQPLDVVANHALDDARPICPDLVDCRDPICAISADLSSPMWKDDLAKELRADEIETVGDLAKLTELRVNRLRVKSPKVPTVLKVLDDYRRNPPPKRSDESLAVEELQGLSESQFCVTDAEAPREDVTVTFVAEQNSSASADVTTNYEKTLDNIPAAVLKDYIYARMEREAAFKESFRELAESVAVKRQLEALRDRFDKIKALTDADALR